MNHVHSTPNHHRNLKIDGKVKAIPSGSSMRLNGHARRLTHSGHGHGIAVRKASLFGAGIFTNRNCSAGTGAAGGTATVKDTEFHRLLAQLAQAHDDEVANLHRSANNAHTEARRVQQQQKEIKTSLLRLSTNSFNPKASNSSSKSATGSSDLARSLFNKKELVKKMFSSPTKAANKKEVQALTEDFQDSPKMKVKKMLTEPQDQESSHDALKIPGAVVTWRSDNSVYPVAPQPTEPPQPSKSKDATQNQAVRSKKRASTMPEEDAMATARELAAAGLSLQTVHCPPNAPISTRSSCSSADKDEDELVPVPVREIDGADRENSFGKYFSLVSSASGYSASSIICVNETAVQDNAPAAADMPEGSQAAAQERHNPCQDHQKEQKHDLEQHETGIGNGRESTATIDFTRENDSDVAERTNEEENDLGIDSSKDGDASLQKSPTRSMSAVPTLPVLAVEKKQKTKERLGGGILKTRFSDQDVEETTSSRELSNGHRGTLQSVAFEAEIHEHEDEKEADALERASQQSTHFDVMDVYKLRDGEEEGFQSFQSMRQQKKEAVMGKRMLTREVTLENLRTVVTNNISVTGGNIGKIRWFDNLVSHPHSNTNFFCDCLSIVLILWDVIMLPMIVFEMPESTFVDVMAHCTASFWSLELIRQFFLGYYLRGNVQMQIRKVIAHYLKTWFLPDFALVSLDWALLIMQQNGTNQETKLNQLMRSVRYIRMLRLLRAVKANRLMKMMEDRINSEQASVIWTMAKHFCCILVLNHLIACAWYGVGYACNQKRPNWVEEFILVSVENSVGYQYTTSFHWALSHFIDSAISVQPQNIYERVFEIITLLFSLLVGATFLSSMTSAIMRLSSLAGHKTKQFWLLRRYLRESGIPKPLAIRIHNFCEHAWDNQSMGVNEWNVHALELLSAPLRMELRMAIFMPRLDIHPFFVLLAKVARDNLMRRICSEAVSRTLMGKGELLFADGEWCSKVIAPQYGLFSYHQLHLDAPRLAVPEQHWLCEAAFWTHWSHRGECLTETVAEAVAIDHEIFREILAKDQIARYEAMTFARSFVHGLNRTDADRLTDLYQGSQHEGLWFRLAQEYGTLRPAASTANAALSLDDEFD